MSDLPVGLHEFLAEAHWSDAEIDPIPGDASFRRYFRVQRPDGERAMLMFAPPPEEDPSDFLHVAQWLTQQGMRAPAIFASDQPQGWVLLEDFGNDRMRDWLDLHPDREMAAYQTAIDALVELHNRPPGPFGPYDMPTYQREAGLFVECFCPAQGLAVDVAGFENAWQTALEPMMARQQRGVTVLRDYHAENIMLLADPAQSTSPHEAQGLIDFQDALVGHRAYDLVSLLQDARRDVSEQLEAAMLQRYIDRAETDSNFTADYARLGAQRNAKIVGIFTRLFKRDGKPRYLDLIPRVWAAMERDLKHPALEPVADWFADNIPEDLRDAGGGTIT